MYSKLFLILFFLIACHTFAFAADGEMAGRIKTVKEPAYVLRGDQKITAMQSMKITKSDTLVTGRQGALGIVFSDNSTMSLGSDTKFQISQYEFNVLERKTGFVGRIRQGTMVYLTGQIAKMNSNATRFETPVAVAGVRGTRLAIKVEGGDNE